MTVGRVELPVAVLWRSFLSGFPLKLLGWCDYCITGDLVAVGFLRVNSLTDCTGILRLMRSSVCGEAASWRLIWTLGGFPVHVWPSFYCWEARTLNQLLSCRVFSNRTATGRQINFSFRSCHFFFKLVSWRHSGWRSRGFLREGCVWSLGRDLVAGGSMTIADQAGAVFPN